MAEQNSWRFERRPATAWLRDHYQVIVESFSYLGQSAAMTMVVWLLIGIALSLPAGLYLLQKNLSAVGSEWRGRPGFSIYLDAATPTPVINRLVNQVRDEPTVSHAWTINPADALASLKEVLGDVLEDIDENPLPFTIRAVVHDNADLEGLVARLSEDPQVDDIVAESTWLKRLAAIRKVVNRIAWAFGILLGLGAVMVTGASVRLAVESRLDELRLLRLIGASDAYIRRPFLYLGILYGMGGASIGAMLVSMMLAFVEFPLGDLMALYNMDLKIAGFDPISLLTVLGTGAVLGILGAVLASQRQLRDLGIM